MTSTLTPTKRAVSTRSTSLNLNGRGFWHHAAPRQLASWRPSELERKRWDLWVRHLKRRRKPVELARLVVGQKWPVGWCYTPPGPRDAPGAFITDLARLHEHRTVRRQVLTSRVQAWLDRPDRAPIDLDLAMQTVALAHGVVALADVLDGPTWWKLLDKLLKLTGTEFKRKTQSLEQPLIGQLMSGELPLSLSYLLPEINACRGLRKDARRFLSASLLDLCDGEGMVEARNLSSLRMLLACWTRCRALGTTFSHNAWNEEADIQYQWVVTQSLRLNRRDGTQLLTSAPDGAWSAALFATALHLGGDASDQAAAISTLPKLPGRPNARSNAFEAVEPATNSEWAGVAVLRPGWSRTGERLAVAYDGQRMEIDLETRGETTFSGDWPVECLSDGQKLTPTSDWEELCWITDDDVDYLELEIELSRGARLQRQMLMARNGRFLYLADCLLELPGARTDYQIRLPLGGDVRFDPAQETREAVLTGARPLARILPIALPEWRDDPRFGSLDTSQSCLQLSMHTDHRNLYCPLFIDFAPKRLRKDCTWRHLTVAEKREILSRDVAVGYRIQCGKDQWLAYRAIDSVANRTLLGQNVSTEFLMAHFDLSGEIDEVVEIE